MGISRRSFLGRAAAISGSTALGATPIRGVGAARRAATTPDAATCPVENIVVLMMENRSFDHMLGRVPGANGLQREMFNDDDEGERVYVHRQKGMFCTIGDPNHGRESSLAQWNGGDNLGFVKDTGTQAMGYMGEQEIPWMYALAREYTVFDHWHCGILGPTWPNRSYFHAGTSGGRTSNGFSKDTLGLHERTVWHQLSAANVPWAIYFTDAPFTALYFELVLRYPQNFRPMYQFYIDAATGNLPRVAMLEPGYFIGTDDHPPVNVQAGQRYMADVVKALHHAPQWPKTALLITYDEHGGFFDHVPPPTMPDDHPALGAPVGFRVPTILVSPWARRGYVAGQAHDHTAATRFIQWRFGLNPLTKRNAAAASILYAFDFSKPRTDIPTLPTPTVDDHLTALCLAGKFIGPEDAIDMPGGEGPESMRKWADADLSKLGRQAVAQRGGDPAPDALAAASALAAPGLPLNRDLPDFEEVLDSGVVPKELDLRPRPEQPTPTPFLQPGMLPERPAWQPPKPRTATKRPRNEASSPNGGSLLGRGELP